MRHGWTFCAGAALIGAFANCSGDPFSSSEGGSQDAGAAGEPGAGGGGGEAGESPGSGGTGGRGGGGGSGGSLKGGGGTQSGGMLGTPKGGMVSTGGAPGSGGVVGKGGAPPLGGMPAEGGSDPEGGTQATGGVAGDPGSGGDPGSAGAGNPTGGTIGTGGTASGGAATGGNPSTGGSGTGGAPPGACPSTPPSNGEPCKSNDVCTYGTHPLPGCRDQFTCKAGFWDVRPGDCTPPGPCGTLPEFDEGEQCDPEGQQCLRDSDEYCFCSSSCTGMGVCTTAVWFCFSAEQDCPTFIPNQGQPCSQGGDVCSYGVCGTGKGSAIDAGCDGGVWTWSEPPCP